MDGNAYLTDVTKLFREIRTSCDRALAQVPAESWRVRLDPGSNSLETLVLHLAGNMLSRWTDFLTTDGEKPDRNRDAEFEDGDLPHAELLARWDKGWACLFEALESVRALGEDGLARTVTIRGVPHTVVQAIDRQLAHYAMHGGQVVFLAKHLAAERWETLTIPRGGSAAFEARIRERR